MNPESTASTFTGEHPIYVPQAEAQTYHNAEAPEDSPREPAASHGDVVNVTNARENPYVQTRVDVTATALRHAISALNKELGQRA